MFDSLVGYLKYIAYVFIFFSSNKYFYSKKQLKDEFASKHDNVCNIISF